MPRSTQSFTVEPAIESDCPQILDIYTYYVLNTTIVFLIHPPPLSFITSKFRSAISAGLPYYVAMESPTSRPSNQIEPTAANGSTSADSISRRKVLGFLSAGPFNASKLGYATSVELTLYIHPDYLSAGLGSALLSRVLLHLKETPYHAHEPDFPDRTQLTGIRNVYAIMSQDVLPGGETGAEGGEGGGSIGGRDVGGWIAKGEKTKDWYVKKFGFVEVGRLNGVGWKFGRGIDVIYLEKVLN